MLTGLRKTLLLGLFLPATAYFAIYFALLDRADSSIRAAGGAIDRTAVDLDTVSPQLALRMGLVPTQPATELVAVVVSATWCSANDIEGYQDAIRVIPRLWRAQTNGRPEMVARVIGISVDSDPRVGTDYLFSLAAFDEVIAGGVGWLNTAAEKYLWGRPYTSAGSIPQVILLRRTLKWSGSILTVEDETELGKRVGAEEIIEWVRLGAPAPKSATAVWADQ